MQLTNSLPCAMYHRSMPSQPRGRDGGADGGRRIGGFVRVEIFGVAAVFAARPASSHHQMVEVNKCADSMRTHERLHECYRTQYRTSSLLRPASCALSHAERVHTRMGLGKKNSNGNDATTSSGHTRAITPYCVFRCRARRKPWPTVSILPGTSSSTLDPSS